MANIQITTEKQGYTTEETKKVAEILNKDDNFKSELLKVFILLYHNQKEDAPTPEFNKLIDTKLKEIEPDENKRELIYINNVLMNCFYTWRNENILPLFEEEVKDVFINKTYFPTLNKCNTFVDYYIQLVNHKYNTNKVKVNKITTLYDYDFERFLNNLLNDNLFLTEGGTNSHYNVNPKYTDENDFLTPDFWGNPSEVQKWRKESYSVTQIIQNTKGNCILIDTQGYTYARYVGFLDNLNGLKPHNIDTPKTDKFLQDKAEGEAERKAEIEAAYLNAYY